jgi:exonuclease VII large subunit
MSQDPQNLSPMFRIDVSAEAAGSAANSGRPEDTLMVATLVALMRQMIQHQEKQNQLLEQLISSTNQMQKQRQTELQQWKEANPHLAKACRKAADTLSRVQTQFLESMTEEIAENQEELLDGEFVLQEFVDKYGPRLAHLNGLLQVVAQLGG